MKSARKILLFALVVASVAASGPVLAHGFHHRGQVHFGLFVGDPFFWPGWHYPPPYYYPPVIAVPASPPVYVEREGSQAAPRRENWWYYCADARAYYPYVKQCPGGWERVSPQPPS